MLPRLSRLFFTTIKLALAIGFLYGIIYAKFIYEPKQGPVAPRKHGSTIKKAVNVLEKPNYNVHIFYYPWYGNIANDKQWVHWNHKYIPNWNKNDKKVYPQGSHVPPDDLGCNYYPKLGAYSSSNATTVNLHMKMIREALIGE